MITEDQLSELHAFRRMEKTLSIRQSPEWSKLVIQNGNDALPVHRWFKFKESFSANLLHEIIKELFEGGCKELNLLDPFCGVGTSLLASQELSAAGYRIKAIGIERNPFIAFAATTKVRWSEINARELVRTGEIALRESKDLLVKIPALSSLTTGRCLSRYLSERLLAISAAIRSKGGDDSTRNALLLGVASSIEGVSRVRKDGRALRIVDRGRVNLLGSLRMKWAGIASDASFFQKTLGKSDMPRVILGDGRKPRDGGIGPSSMDIIVTSPPYPNNIDYSEVYKLELWLLGFMSDRQSFLDLRKTTFRSHPLCSEPPDLDNFMVQVRGTSVEKLLRPILKRISGDCEPWRLRVLLGYCYDMLVALREQFECLKRGGFSVIIVGNSLHGGSSLPYLIPTDLIVAALGELVGFKVKHITAARSLKRRLVTNHFLRESIVVLYKADG